MSSAHLLFVGTYTRNDSQGIYSVRLDPQSGALSEPEPVATTPNPTWLTLSPNRDVLYANHPSVSQAIGYRIDGKSGRLTPLAAPRSATPAAAPSHLAIDATGQTMLVANYHDGFVAAIPLAQDGTPGTPSEVRHHGRSVDPIRQASPHPHSVTISPDNRWVVACDLGTDRIHTYGLDPDTSDLRAASPGHVSTTPGAGPRHFTFSRDGRLAYAINELDNTLTVFDFKTAIGSLVPRKTVSTLPAGFTGKSTAAEIRIHPNGRYIYGSNRGHDSLAVFRAAPNEPRLEPVAVVPSGGRTPRNFALSPDGSWLVCAHQDSDNLWVFRVDPDTGRLTATGHGARIPMGVCVTFHQ